MPPALLVVLGVLLVASGCSRQQPTQHPGLDATPPAPNLMRMAALCHEHGGEWIKSNGCRMTEPLCAGTYHGTWKDASCAVPLSEIKGAECNRAGGHLTTSEDACLIQFLDLDDSQYMK